MARIRNFNLTTTEGEFVVLVGPSGCGKTTTMRMIAGLETVTEGEIKIGGRNVVGMIPRERDVAMVFQNYALFPHLNVFGNLSFGLRLRKFPKTRTAERVYSAAKILGIEHLLERKPKELSGGERQRVAAQKGIKDAWVGIRPEHLVIERNPASTIQNVIKGTVDVVEPQGATSILQINIGEEKKILAQVNEQWGREAGENLTLTVASDLVHLFDPNTDESIR